MALSVAAYQAWEVVQYLQRLHWAAFHLFVLVAVCGSIVTRVSLAWSRRNIGILIKATKVRIRLLLLPTKTPVIKIHRPWRLLRWLKVRSIP